MKRASYLSRLIRGAGEQPVLVPPRMLFRPAAEHRFTEIDTAPSIATGDLSTKSASARRDVSEGRVSGLEALQDASHGNANAPSGPRDASQRPTTNLTAAHSDFRQASAKSSNAEPDVDRVSTNANSLEAQNPSYGSATALNAPREASHPPASLTVYRDFGQASARSSNAEPHVKRVSTNANGPEARQDRNQGRANALNVPREESQRPASLTAYRDFSQVSAKSSNAEPDVKRVSTEPVTAGPASSNTPRPNVFDQVAPARGRRASFNKGTAAETGSVGLSAPPKSDGPVGRPKPVSDSHEAADPTLLAPKSTAGQAKTPPIATDRERPQTMGQPTAELKAKSRRTTIDPEPVGVASHPVLMPRQGFESGRSDSPGKNSSSALPVVLVPPAPSERVASANRPENRGEAAVGAGPAVRIGTLEVRINPPPPPAVPQSPSARSRLASRPVVSLARGFGSFGLVQG